MNCDVSHSSSKLMCSLVVQTHSTLRSHHRHLEINRSIATKHKRCHQSRAKADVQTATLPEHRGACSRESMLSRGRAGGTASAPANYRASWTLANGKWLCRVCQRLTENHQGPEKSNCHLQGHWLFPCFAVSWRQTCFLQAAKYAKALLKMCKINKYTSQIKKIFLSLWNEKMHETDTGVWVQSPQMAWVSSLALTIKERFLRSLALSFPGNCSFFNMWPCLAKMSLSDSGTDVPGKAPKPLGNKEFTLWLGN